LTTFSLRQAWQEEKLRQVPSFGLWQTRHGVKRENFVILIVVTSSTSDKPNSRACALVSDC
jgi:hypothetical protein